MEIAINYGAVVACAIVSMGIGGLWYGPVFGSFWMRLLGTTKEEMKAMKLSPAAAMGIMFALSLLMFYVLAHAIGFGSSYTNMSGVAGGMMGAFWYWLGFVLPLTAGSFLWEGKSWKLWALNAAYYFVTLLLAGAILGGFPA